MRCPRQIPGLRQRLLCRPGYDGYTIIELVLVIVILAVLAAMAGPRFFDNSAFDERAYYDEVVSALRYAQKVAVASGCRVQVSLGVTDYALAQQPAQAGHCDPLDANFVVPVRLSTGDAVNGTAPAGITTIPTVTFVYTPLGQTSFASDQTVTVGSRAMIIQAESGLVATP